MTPLGEARGDLAMTKGAKQDGAPSNGRKFMAKSWENPIWGPPFTIAKFVQITPMSL